MALNTKCGFFFVTDNLILNIYNYNNCLAITTPKTGLQQSNWNYTVACGKGLLTYHYNNRTIDDCTTLALSKYRLNTLYFTSKMLRNKQTSTAQ